MCLRLGQEKQLPVPPRRKTSSNNEACNPLTRRRRGHCPALEVRGCGGQGRCAQTSLGGMGAGARPAPVSPGPGVAVTLCGSWTVNGRARPTEGCSLLPGRRERRRLHRGPGRARPLPARLGPQSLTLHRLSSVTCLHWHLCLWALQPCLKARSYVSASNSSSIPCEIRTLACGYVSLGEKEEAGEAWQRLNM